jgi:hypothetical protein
MAISGALYQKSFLLTPTGYAKHMYDLLCAHGKSFSYGKISSAGTLRESWREKPLRPVPLSLEHVVKVGPRE